MINVEKEEKIIRNVETSMNMEGLFLGEIEKDLIQKYLHHELTEKEGIQKIISMYQGE